jgi:hypothetical protein
MCEMWPASHRGTTYMRKCGVGAECWGVERRQMVWQQRTMCCEHYHRTMRIQTPTLEQGEVEQEEVKRSSTMVRQVVTQRSHVIG